MCSNGFQIANSLAKALVVNEKHIQNNQELTNMFINPSTNNVYEKGDTIKLPKLGNTLKVIAEQGIDAFYNGILTGFIISEINENGIFS